MTYNCIKTSTTATAIGTGNATVASNAAARARPLSDIPVGKQAVLRIEDESGTDWELSLCTILSATTFSRDTVLNGSSGPGVKVNFSAGAKAVQCVIEAGEFNALAGVRDIPFASSIPLTAIGESFMQPATVSSGLTFTAAAGAVRGALVYLRLTADGTNVPTFSGMKQWGGSQDFDARNSIVNVIQFFYDGADVWYSIAQAVGATPIASKPGAPTIGSASAGDGTASVSFTAPASNGGATITSYTVTAYKASDNSVVGTVNVTSSPASFTGLTSGVGVYFKAAATNSAGTGTQSAASNTVTPAAAAVTYTRLSSLSGVTESGSGPYSYTGQSGQWLNGAGGVSNQLPAGTDGSVSFTINALSASNGFLIGVTSGSSKVAYGSTLMAIYPDTQSNSNYNAITAGNAAARTNTGVTAQAGDIVRMRRAGSSFIAEYARAATPTTWNTLYTWSGQTTGAVYFQVDVTGASAIAQNVTGVGLA